MNEETEYAKTDCIFKVLCEWFTVMNNSSGGKTGQLAYWIFAVGTHRETCAHTHALPTDHTVTDPLSCCLK